MARKVKQEDPPVGSPAWMATFSDLMNLLLCFFVLLFSMSSVDAEKYQQVSSSLANSFSIFSGGGATIGEGTMISDGVSQLNELEDYYNNLGAASEEEEVEEGDPLEKYKEALEKEQKEQSEELYEEVVELSEKETIQDYVQIGLDPNYQYVQISMSGAILFDSGKADIKQQALPILKKIGNILKRYDKYMIKIEGHTDNVPISGNGRYQSNMELSADRAIRVFDYLVKENKLDPKTLEASGRSEYNPIASNKTESERSKNRRVEIKIYSASNN